MAQARANQCASLPPRTPQRLPHRRRDWAESACCTRPLSFCPVWRSRDVGAPRKCPARAGPSSLRYSSVHGRWGGWCAWLEYLRGVTCVIRRVGRRHDVQHANICRREASARGDAACCDPVQHVATQCSMLRPSATCCDPVQTVATQCNKPSATCCNTFCRREAEARSRPGNLSHGRVRDATCAAGTQWWPWMHPRWGVGSGTAAGRHRRGAEREPGAAERVPRRNGRPSQAPARAPRSAHGRSDQDGPNGTPRPKRCTHRPCEMNGRWEVRASVSSRAGGGRPGEGRRASEQAAARRTGHIQTSPCKSPTTSSSAGATSLPAAPRPAARSSASCMRAERSRLCRLDRCTARNRPPA